MEKSNKESVSSNTPPTSIAEAYLATLCEKRRKGYEIAKQQLGDSFSLEKAVGFIDWLKTTQK
jgi:hypothetical protein